MQVQDIIAGTIVGIVVSAIGVYMLFNRAALVDAFNASGKAFLGKLTLLQPKDPPPLLSKVMITIMGIVFLGGGILTICKIIYYVCLTQFNEM